MKCYFHIAVTDLIITLMPGNQQTFSLRFPAHYFDIYFLLDHNPWVSLDFCQCVWTGSGENSALCEFSRVVTSHGSVNNTVSRQIVGSVQPLY